MSSLKNDSAAELASHQDFPTQIVLLSTIVVLFLTALIYAWWSSINRANTKLEKQAIELTYSTRELDRARQRISDMERAKPHDYSRVLSSVDLDRVNFSDTSITSSENAFQNASLIGCNFQDASLEGGHGAFQRATFDKAILKNATLTGDAASFQYATFVNADLTDAVLRGTEGSFQLASFENATLIGATLAGSFQMVNFNGVRMEGADLSGIHSVDLSTCYFKDPPTYNTQTKFPVGFDPARSHWNLVRD